MNPGLLISIALLSATSLAYEVLLTRLFAIIQWHHFASMVISLALLGYGASGSFLALLENWLRERFAGFFIGNALLFAVSLIAGFLIAQQLPFNALEIGWDLGQLWYLLAMYLLLAVPFFCAANAFGLAFMHYRRQIHRIYAFDLVGAGAGALGVILLLFVVFPGTALQILGALGLIAAVLAALACRRHLPWVIITVAGMVIITAGLPQRWTALNPSPYKDLSQALRVMGATKIDERSSPLGLVTVVRNDRVPFRHAPGLSLAATALPPKQLGLFSDGGGLGAITRFTGEREPLAYLDYLTSALPYHLLDKPHVLVLGAGGGADILQALYHQARLIDAVELNPQVADLVGDAFGEFTGRLFARPDARLHIGEARGFVAGSRERYDLIQVALLDAFGTAGLHALSESYLYTVEAFQDYLRHLDPGGLLAVTRWLRLPPRDSLKLFATALRALERAGVADPGERLVLIRGWKTTTLLVKNGPFTPEDITKIQEFCRQRSFDTAWYPGLSAAGANRYNLLERDYFHEGAVALLSPAREEFLKRYKFNITPATDDRPYFFQFFKWRALPELLALQARGGLGQLEWGYLILAATLAQALLAGVVLILLPLELGGRRASVRAQPNRRRVLAYFTAIGLGFLFLEIAFIQKFILFLTHPLYAVAVVLCAFLVFAGLGSGYSRRFQKPGSALAWAVAGIAALAGIYLVILPLLVDHALAWPDPVKIICAVALIAPLAFCMGLPFPLGLARVAETAPGLVPWAWAINGCASVVSAVLATLLAVEIGFSGVVIAAVLLYLVAALALPRPAAGPAAL